MRILWLKSELLHPVDKGGKIRTYQMLRHLAREHDVTYLTLVDPDDPKESFERASEYSSRLVTIPFAAPPKHSAAFYRDLALAAASPVPYAVLRYRSAEMRRAIERELAERDYDVVVCDFLVPSINLPSRLGTTAVLFQHNVESMIWRRHAETAGNALKRAFFGSQYRKMLAYERAACRRFDAVAAVSVEDRDHMREAFGLERVYDVPTGVDADYFLSTTAAANPHELVFTGSMDWMPNEDAILYFVREIMPRVVERIPDLTLTVVGRTPTEPLVALAAENPRVTLTGRVDDVRPYVERGAAYVVPMRVGGGTRLKIYEAMAMERPVVSTAIGAEGLPVRDGEEIVLADSPEDFAHAVVRVLTDEGLGARIAASALRFVRERMSWERAATELADICERAIAARRVEDRAAPDARPPRPATNRLGTRAS